jgi:hypothetical protein
LQLLPHPVPALGDYFSNTVLPQELANPLLHATGKGCKHASGPTSHLPLLNQYVSCKALDRIFFFVEGVKVLLN